MLSEAETIDKMKKEGNHQSNERNTEQRTELFRRSGGRHRQQQIILGRLPFFLEFRSLDSQKFAARRIVHKHSFALPIDSGRDNIV